MGFRVRLSGKNAGRTLAGFSRTLFRPHSGPRTPAARQGFKFLIPAPCPYAFPKHSMSDLSEQRRRAHIERMLLRACKRLRQAEKIVAKWEVRKAELGREASSQTQPRLWQEEVHDAE